MTNTADVQPNHWRTTRKVVTQATRVLSYLVYLYLLAVEVILLLGFFLLLFGANTSAGFTEWVYRSMDRAMKPFRGIFTPIELGTTAGNEIQSVFETSVLFAMIVYGVVGIAIYSFIGWLTHRIGLIERQERDEQYAATTEQLASAARMDALAATAAAAASAPPSGTSQPVPSAPVHPDAPSSAAPPPPPPAV